MFGEVVASGLGISADVCYQKPVRAPSMCGVNGWGGLSLLALSARHKFCVEGALLWWYSGVTPGEARSGWPEQLLSVFLVSCSPVHWSRVLSAPAVCLGLWGWLCRACPDALGVPSAAGPRAGRGAAGPGGPGEDGLFPGVRARGQRHLLHLRAGPDHPARGRQPRPQVH